MAYYSIDGTALILLAGQKGFVARLFGHPLLSAFLFFKLFESHNAKLLLQVTSVECSHWFQKPVLLDYTWLDIYEKLLCLAEYYFCFCLLWQGLTSLWRLLTGCSLVLYVELRSHQPTSCNTHHVMTKNIQETVLSSCWSFSLWWSESSCLLMPSAVQYAVFSSRLKWLLVFNPP